MKQLIFLGTNSILERYIEACERQGQPIAGIIDSDWFGNRESFAGLPILDSQTIFETDPDRYRDFVFFIGTNWNPNSGRDISKRKMFIDLVRRHQLTCINLIDPLSYVSKHCKLGQGIFIGANCYIEPFCVIEDFALIYGGNGIGHNSEIGENTVIQRDAGMHAKIGQDCYIGIGSYTIRNGDIKIGNNVVVAPCLHVARDVNDNENITLSKDAIKIYRSKNETI
jgi:UDP-3-O-[3-hydroxymyristoyl] glucosamine N-acyltransferase